MTNPAEQLWPDTEDPDVTAMRLLAVKQIETAIRHARGDYPEYTLFELGIGAHPQTDAIYWLESRDARAPSETGGTTFEWCCEILGWNAEAIRRRMLLKQDQSCPDPDTSR